MSSEKKEDLRVIKTKSVIKKTFIELADTIGYHKITVKDICSKAMINRNTFYLHYQNKDDLVRAMLSEVIEKYKINIIPIAAQFFIDVQNKDIEKFSKNIESLLRMLYTDIELFKIILTDDHLTGYFRSVEQAYEKKIIEFLNIKTNKARLIFRYMMSGCGGVLTDWIVRSTLPIEDTARIIAKLALDNISYFTEENRKIPTFL